MRRQVILDTGPLVAYLHRREALHSWAKSLWMQLEPPLLTCEAVLTEASHIHVRLGGRVGQIVELILTGAVRVPFCLGEEAKHVAVLLQRYSNVPMSFADSCLVRMAELHAGSAVMTTDQHFRIYRIHGREIISTIMPGGPGAGDDRSFSFRWVLGDTLGLMRQLRAAENKIS